MISRKTERDKSMGMTREDKRRRKGHTSAAVVASGAAKHAPPLPALEPLGVPLKLAIQISGLSRSDIYRRKARGELIFRKSGRTVIVDYQSLKAVALGLPMA